MERVLLVEDELDELEILYWLLSDHGLLLSHDATSIDVIRELRRVVPGLPALIITRVAPAELRAGLGDLGNVHVMYKPFTPEELVSRLAGLTHAA